MRKPPRRARLHRFIVSVGNALCSSRCRNRMRVALRVARMQLKVRPFGGTPGLERADSGKRTTGPARPGAHFGQALTLCCLACLHGNGGKIRSAQIPKSRECIFSRLTCTISLSGTASRYLHPHLPYPTHHSRISHRCRLEYRSDSSYYNPQTPWTSTQFRDP